ncbi:hypothetical protein HMPREF1147_1568 [Selenomonas sp. FOBRC9]|nr:hypothetical protein HMPREF1147_1568 [Selenomonas sp. FOBRC9]
MLHLYFLFLMCSLQEFLIHRTLGSRNLEQIHCLFRRNFQLRNKMLKICSAFFLGYVK